VNDFVYFQPEQYYIDLYDLITIHRTLDVVDIFQKTYPEMLKDTRNTETPAQTRNHLNRMLYDQLFYVLTERYEKKKDTIAEWVEKDRREQDRYDNTSVPQNIRCKCGTLMHTTFKDLYTGSRSTFQKMLFFFECPNCKKRRGIFEDGKAWVVKPDRCSKCNKEVTVKSSRKGDVITRKRMCASCGHIEKEVDDLSEGRAEREKEEQKDKALLNQYRHLFCFTEEQGQAALNEREAIEVAAVIKEEEREKYDSLAYTQASQLKRLKIADLEKRLFKPLTKAQYIKFSLDKPEDGLGFVVPFSVQDADSTRTGRASEYALKQLINNLLADTNWRLVGSHISYRLGYLSGRIRGYESEEDLMELYKEDQPKKAKTKITQEMRQKHSYTRWVRLAKISGEYEGIRNVRMRRLEKEPDGFFLEPDKEGSYTCGICGEQSPCGTTWWTPDGLTCIDCHRNIKEGVIPDLQKQEDNTYIKEFQISSDFSIHPSTRRMLERKGILKGRELKRQNGSVYETIYLVEENVEFLEKYPKKPKMEVNFAFPWTAEGITVDPQYKEAKKVDK
jgi:hypothetical protein